MKPLVLVVDQDADNRDLYCSYLVYEGFDCVSAADGDQALQLIRERVPHVVLLDVRLPHVDGWALAQQVKSNPLLQSIRVVMLTADGSPDDRVRAASVRADGFLPKPAPPQDVVYVIRALLESAGPDAGTVQ